MMPLITSLDTQTKLLARVYALILIWPDPPENMETTDREDFGETARSAEEETEIPYNNRKSESSNSTTTKRGSEVVSKEKIISQLEDVNWNHNYII